MAAASSASAARTVASWPSASASVQCQRTPASISMVGCRWSCMRSTSSRTAATRSAAGSGSANRTVKALVARAFDTELADGLALERRLVAEHMRSADAAEGLRAFAEKRKPRF